ncbi:hypothetical protein [Vibrio algivorus]|uniref:Uncharacterized protein n=1 Tax=Vibrio algivorus TaxID=1667024 RepID=A0ABQ6ELB8_9VIBR|nr:hypothetical protein [Vibrio algivorus]GLT13918.1 hypothetical protein GCM10007931_08920 [Vibrio algivorus]
MTEITSEELKQKIEGLEKIISNMKTDLSITKQLLEKSTRADPTGSVAISDLPAISDDEIGENPQLILEHATGTKRGFLSQLLDQLPDLEVTDIPAAVNSTDSGSGFGGFRYTVDGSTLNLFTS